MAKNVTRTFPKQLLKDLLWDDCDGYEIIEDVMIDKSRWSIHYNLVFKELETGKLYEIGYSRGATESQEEEPFEYEADQVKCTEVAPVEVKIIKFAPVQE